MMPDPTSFQSVGWIALLFFGMAGGINQILHIVDRVKGKPPVESLQLQAQVLSERVDHVEREIVSRATTERLETLEHDFKGFVSKESAYRRELYDRINSLQKDMKSDLSDTRIELKQDIGGVHTRITDLTTAFAEIKGAFLQSQRQP